MGRPMSTVRHLTVAQGLYVGGSTVDLTITGIVGYRLAPTAALGTLPLTLIFLAAGLATFLVSRAIGRLGHRTVFVATSLAAAASGLVCAWAVWADRFWLFCVGTALVGVYAASAGYYRYVAAESMPDERARAVSVVLAGGLVAALVGPFVATGLRDATSTPYVASYLLVSVLGLAAAAWNGRLVVGPVGRSPGLSAATDPDLGAPRTMRVLWTQRPLLLGVAAAVLASATMLAMMTAGPILGVVVGRSPGEAALAIQLHLVGMYAPGFLVARSMARVGERLIAVLGAVLIAAAGAAAVVSVALPTYLLAMFAVGVGWNLAFSGGSALIAASYRAGERGRVQPVAEVLILVAQVGGSVSAISFTSLHGWRVLGATCIALSVVVGCFLLLQPLGRARRLGASVGGRRAAGP